MSSRQLRKLQQQRELEQAKLQAQQEEKEEEEENESEDEPVVFAPPKPSLFANFAALEDEGENSEDSQKEAEDNLSDHNPAPTSTAKKSKKSKKKKKKAAKAAKAADSPAENTETPEAIDDIDVALKELNLKQNHSGAQTVQVDPEYQRVCALLGVNSQHLKVANEMRNLFGKGIFDTHTEDEPQGGRGGRQRQPVQEGLEGFLKGRHPKGKGLPEVTLRRNAFIQGKDDWPKSSLGGLSMEVVDDKAEDGTVEFKYLYSEEYTRVQLSFREAVERGDPDLMIGLLQRNPYNISLLLVVSKIAKNQGDHALAADLLERALFTFGRAATTMFNTKMTQGKARLDFARPENRELWLAGFHYLKALLMKGTYRTALEWAKFLLSLDPEGDPYCMRLLIHNYALKCHEFQYLLDLYDSQLPGLWAEDSTSVLSVTYPSLAYAAMQLKEPTRCRELLSTAMQTTPWTFNRLFQEINLDSPPSIWGITARTDAETLFTEIYVLQTKDLWKTPAATSLLMEIAHTIPKVSEKTIPKLENSAMTLDIVRYVYVDDNPAIMKYAPSHILHRQNNSDYDPLPPPNNIYSSYSVQSLDDEGGFSLGPNMNNPLLGVAGIMDFLNRNGPALAAHGIDAAAVRRDLEERRNREIARQDEGDAVQAGEEVEQRPEEVAAENVRTNLLQRVLNMMPWANIPRGDDEMPPLIEQNENPVPVEEDSDEGEEIQMPGRFID